MLGIKLQVVRWALLASRRCFLWRDLGRPAATGGVSSARGGPPGRDGVFFAAAWILLPRPPLLLKFTFDVFNVTNTASFDIPIDDVTQNINFNGFPAAGQSLYVSPTLSGLGITNKDHRKPETDPDVVEIHVLIHR